MIGMVCHEIVWYDRYGMLCYGIVWYDRYGMS